MASNARAERRRAQRSHTHGPVVVSTLSPGQMSSFTADSLAALFLHDGCLPEQEQVLCRKGGGKIMSVSGPRIAETRSQIVDAFLTSPSFEGAEWLLMVDSDMVFRPEDFRLVLESADPLERPIVGGLCFAGLTPESMYPTIYGAKRLEDGKLDLDKVFDYPRDQLVKVGATGAAFMLVHRRVFTAMSRPHPDGFGTYPDGTPNVFPWFVEGHVDGDGRPFGEDISFCMRAGALGFPIYVHTGARIGHHKSVILTEELFDRRPT